MMEPNYLSLSQFQQLLGNTIRLSRDLQNVWVRAEMSDLRVVGGHCYMELIEKDSAGTTRAKIRAMIWSSALGAIRRKFFEATGRDISSGLKVLVRGSATHHNLYGLSFTISDIDPSYSLGDMERIRREILERLTREGVAGFNRSLTVPAAPQRIAIISAEGAAGYGDFMNQIHSNPAGFAIYTGLFPAVMQGERTAPTVLEALDKVEFTRSQWDAVAIIRGGGATTDLNGFDNYDIARRVATFPIPVIVGIGHERDRTVLDELACVRCKTPTAVAEFIIGAIRDAYDYTTSLVNRIARYGADALKGEHLRLSSLSQSVPALAKNQVMRHRMALADLYRNIPAIVQRHILNRRIALADCAGRLRLGCAAVIGARNLELDRFGSRLSNSANAISERQNLRLKRLDDMLRILSPDNTLRRGFSITRLNGKAVSDPAALRPGDKVETTLAGGKFTATVD